MRLSQLHCTRPSPLFDLSKLVYTSHFFMLVQSELASTTSQTKGLLNTVIFQILECPYFMHTLVYLTNSWADLTI